MTIDPITFINQVLVNPETNRPFTLYPTQERFLREAFSLTPDGRLRYPVVLDGKPKKAGKTAQAGMAGLYVGAVLAPRFGEIVVAANDLEQSVGRVWTAAARMAEASPLLRNEVKITGQRIEFKRTGTIMQAVANDFAGMAGANPNYVFIDEPWAVTSEASQRMLDELVPPPTRQIAGQYSTTYAGFLGESEWLWRLYQRGLQGAEIAPNLYAQPGSMLMGWHTEPVAPWQTEAWLLQMKEQLRPNAYARMCQNKWVSSESVFIEPEWYAACVDPQARPIVANKSLPIYVGLDASSTGDHTAISAFTWDRSCNKARHVWHRIWKPSREHPVPYADVEATILELRERFMLRQVIFDPYNLTDMAQRLKGAGIHVEKFDQNIPNLTRASQNLYELFRGRNLILYPDDDIRIAANRAVAVEGSRGWRIAKATASAKVDIIVAMGMAVLGATLGQRRGSSGVVYLQADQAPEPRPVRNPHLTPLPAYRPRPWTYGSAMPCPLPANQRRTR
jgi:phage terminase large subunit-like protein